MPKPIPEYLNYFLEDCLMGVEGISVRAMFGGYGIYKFGKIFGIFVHDVIYFKVGDNNKHFFEERGSRPFTYQKKGEKSYSMRYMELPEAIMENREELELWIERSIEVKTGKRK